MSRFILPGMRGPDFADQQTAIPATVRVIGLYRDGQTELIENRWMDLINVFYRRQVIQRSLSLQDHYMGRERIDGIELTLTSIHGSDHIEVVVPLGDVEIIDKFRMPEIVFLCEHTVYMLFDQFVQPQDGEIYAWDELLEMRDGLERDFRGIRVGLAFFGRQSWDVGTYTPAVPMPFEAPGVASFDEWSSSFRRYTPGRLDISGLGHYDAIIRCTRDTAIGWTPDIDIKTNRPTLGPRSRIIYMHCNASNPYNWTPLNTANSTIAGRSPDLGWPGSPDSDPATSSTPNPNYATSAQAADALRASKTKIIWRQRVQSQNWVHKLSVHTGKAWERSSFVISPVVGELGYIGRGLKETLLLLEPILNEYLVEPYPLNERLIYNPYDW